MSKIDHFDTYWLCLSNFAAAPTLYGGRLYPTSEHAYQAAKVTDPANKELVASAATPGLAKKLGQKYKDHQDWDAVKLGVMTEVVRAKFTQNQDLADILLSTGEALLEEGNHWGDSFWGVLRGQGESHLGKILMSVRSELRRNKDEAFSWLRIGPAMLCQLSDLPLDALKVFEKIGEELGEFQDEIIKAKSPEDLAEEAVDLLVTSMAAVEAFLRMAQSSGAGTAFFWPSPSTSISSTASDVFHNVFDVGQATLPLFISAYGRLARSQRKWRSKPSPEAAKTYLDATLSLAAAAFTVAGSLQSREALVATYTKKVAKWRLYATTAKV